MSATFQVIVPYYRRSKLRHVSYPMSGHPYYAREQAIEVLRVFETKRGKQYGTRLECWAETDGERFTLQDIDSPETIGDDPSVTLRTSQTDSILPS